MRVTTIVRTMCSGRVLSGSLRTMGVGRTSGDIEDGVGGTQLRVRWGGGMTGERDSEHPESPFIQTGQNNPSTTITGLSVSGLSARLISRATLRDRDVSSSDVYRGRVSEDGVSD